MTQHSINNSNTERICSRLPVCLDQFICAATGKCVEATKSISHIHLSNEEETPFTRRLGCHPSVAWAHRECSEGLLTAGIWTKTNHLSAPGRRKINVINLCKWLSVNIFPPSSKEVIEWSRGKGGWGRIHIYMCVYISKSYIYIYKYICNPPSIFTRQNFSSEFSIKREDWSIYKYRRKGCFSYLLAILGWKGKDCSLHHREKAKGLITWFVLLRSLSRIILCWWRGRWFTTLKADVRELETK